MVVDVEWYWENGENRTISSEKSLKSWVQFIRLSVYGDGVLAQSWSVPQADNALLSVFRSQVRRPIFAKQFLLDCRKSAHCISSDKLR